MHSRGHQPPQNAPYVSVREYNRRISACARRRDLTGALRTLDDLDRAPNVSRNLFTYNAVINALVMCSQHSKATEFWQQMQDSGIEPNLVTFNTMMKSCFGGMDDDVRRAFALIREMEERGISADRVTLNSLINSCVSAGRVRDAQQVYEQMRTRNIEPDDFTFTTLAKAGAAQNDVEMLDALLLHQLHHHTTLQQRAAASVTVGGAGGGSSVGEQTVQSAQISPVAYNTIADAYIRCGHPERALDLLARMRDVASIGAANPALREDIIPVRPDVQTFNVRLKALREAGATAGEAFDVLEQMKILSLEADHITLLTLADLCCRREEMALAEGVLHAATDSDIREQEKASPEWKALCHSRNGSRNGTRTGSRSGHGMSAGGTHPNGQRNGSGFGGSVGYSSSPGSYNSSGRRNANQPRNAKANAALFNALIRGYSSLDPPNVDAAVALYMEMRRYVETYGFLWYAADSVTYTMLVDGFARVGDSSRAEVIVSEMEAAGRANVVAYNAYLKANRGNGFKAALSVLDRMRKAGLRPDVVSYNTIIDFLSSEENGTQLAEELVRVDMPRNGVRPDLLTFNTLIKGVARNRGNKSDAGAALGSAYRWLRELQSRGLKPDEFTYQSMVSAAASAGDAPRALEFFRKVEEERAKRARSCVLGGSLSSAASVGVGNMHSSLHSTAQSASVGLSSSPSSTGSTVLPFGCSQRGEPTDINGTCESVTRSRLTGKLGDGASNGTSPNDWMLLPHPAAYIALMRAFLTSGGKDGVDSVLLLRDEMVARGLELGRAGYTAVADAYAERADFDSVEATLREMTSRERQFPDQRLSPVHHCIRMKALCNSNRLDDAIAIIPEVENADTAVFNVLIFACSRAKDMDRMLVVLRAMDAANVEPDIITGRALNHGMMMRSVARTLKTFDQRFHSSITKLTNGALSNNAPVSDQGPHVSANWPASEDDPLPVFSSLMIEDGGRSATTKRRDASVA